MSFIFYKYCSNHLILIATTYSIYLENHNS